MKNQTYIRCPRCELNYILKKDKFCNVCKQEMKALGTLGAEEDMELCPICKVNYIGIDEEMCPSCAKEREMEDGESEHKFHDDGWHNYSDSEDEENYTEEETGDMVSITNLEDTPLEDDEMDLGLTDDDEPTEEDDTFDGEFDDAFDNLDDEEDEEEDDDDDYDDEEDDYEDDFNDKPKKSSKKKGK